MKVRFTQQVYIIKVYKSSIKYKIVIPNYIILYFLLLCSTCAPNYHYSCFIYSFYLFKITIYISGAGRLGQKSVLLQLIDVLLVT